MFSFRHFWRRISKITVHSKTVDTFKQAEFGTSVDVHQNGSVTWKVE